MSKAMEFNNFLSQVQGLFHMVASSLRTTTRHLLLFKTDVNTALHGSLTLNLLSMKHFYKAQKEIEPKLGVGRDFPASLRNMGWYFWNIPIIMLPDGGQVRLILDIPIFNHNEVYDLYQEDQIPVYIKNVVVVAAYSRLTGRTQAKFQTIKFPSPFRSASSRTCAEHCIHLSFTSIFASLEHQSKDSLWLP